MRASASSSTVTESVRCGTIGMRNTVTANPASVAARTVSNRAWNVGAPASRVCRNCSSGMAIDIARWTGTRRRASASNGRSRRSSVPLVSTENGVPLAARVSMISGMSR